MEDQKKFVERINLDEKAYEILFDMQKELKYTLEGIGDPDVVVPIEDLANQAIKDCKAYKEFFEEIRERFLEFDPMGKLLTGNE